MSTEKEPNCHSWWPSKVFHKQTSYFSDRVLEQFPVTPLRLSAGSDGDFLTPGSRGHLLSHTTHYPSFTTQKLNRPHCWPPCRLWTFLSGSTWAASTRGPALSSGKAGTFQTQDCPPLQHILCPRHHFMLSPLLYLSANAFVCQFKDSLGKI